MNGNRQNVEGNKFKKTEKSQTKRYSNIVLHERAAIFLKIGDFQKRVLSTCTEDPEWEELQYFLLEMPWTYM